MVGVFKVRPAFIVAHMLGDEFLLVIHQKPVG